MERRSGSTKLAPAGFVVEHAEIDSDCVFLDVRAVAISATCPAWTVVIACVENGRSVVGVIHEPSSGEAFAAHKGGGAALNGRPIRPSSALRLDQGSLATGFSNRRENEEHSRADR